MNKKGVSEGPLDKVKKLEVNPILLGGVALFLLAAVLYVFVARPKQNEDKILREWNTPEAAAARSPEGRKKDPAYEAAIQAALAREGKVKQEGRRSQ
jgi:hypothetical protein